MLFLKRFLLVFTIICFIVAEVFMSILNVLFVLGFKSKKIFLLDFFPSAITEDITLENAVPLFAHYHGIICSCRDKNFGNNCGIFGVLYYECINSPFMLYKFYLQVLCRIIFNYVTKKILPKLLSDYDANSFHKCQQRTICNKQLCPATERKKCLLLLSKKLFSYVDTFLN